MIEAYPLCWPAGIPRTNDKKKSQFKTALKTALNNVRNSLNLFGKDSGTATENIIISSNYTLGDEKPKDCGVAVWFVWEKKQLCIAVDLYPKLEDNLQAIHHIIEARRTELRHGGLHVIRQTFTGFKGIPEKATIDNIWSILDMIPTKDASLINSRYRERAKQVNGDEAKMYELNEAKSQAIKYAQS